MAPMCPEEVDVFTVPHSRMKELVNKYLNLISLTNFSSVSHLTSLLQSLYNTFHEFKAHEQIENRFIMKKLKYKLRALSIQNTAVCNCHKDDQLTDMLHLLQDGYKCTKKSDVDRINFGIQLKEALESFTQTFLPHMAEEEQVFQPLLMKYFTVEELKQIKAVVIQEHFCVESETYEKYVEDNVTREVPQEESRQLKEAPKTSFASLSDEMVLKIFSHLNPQDLCRTAQVSHRWQQLSFDGSLWGSLFPVQWARGNWDADAGVDLEDEVEDAMEKLNNKKMLDEDADIDESEDADGWDTEALEIQRQSSMLTSLCRHVLPRVGAAVKVCDLAYSKGITNGTMYKIFSQCPNLESLDLTQTRVSDLGFKSLTKPGCGSRLKHVNLTGCLFITDVTLQRLAGALDHTTCHMTSEGTAENVGVEKCDTEQNDTCCSCPVENASEDSCSQQGSDAENLITENSEARDHDYQQESERCCRKSAVEDVSIDRCGCPGQSAGTTWVEIEGVTGCQGNGKEGRGRTDAPWSDVGVGDSSCGCDTQGETGRDFVDKISLSSLSDDQQKQAYINFQDVCDRIVSEIQTFTSGSPETGCRLAQSKERTKPCDGRHHSKTTGDGACWRGAPDTQSGNQARDEDGLETKPWTSYPNIVPNNSVGGKGLEFLSLSGCYRLSDWGLQHLAGNGGLPALKYLDLSGCFNLTAGGLTTLVDTCVSLDPRNLFYCDNIMDGPYADTASGCQNLQCSSRVCCRSGE